MTVDPQPTLPDPRTDEDLTTGIEPGNGRSATPPAEGPDSAGTPRDPQLPDD